MTPGDYADGHWDIHDAGHELRRLILAMDAAMAATGANNSAGSGLAAALRVTALLQQHHIGWSDIIVGDEVLAKLCGRLGSEFPAEQETAYTLAARRIQRARSSWAASTRIPKAFVTQPPRPQQARPQPAHRPQPKPAPPRRDPPPRTPPHRDPPPEDTKPKDAKADAEPHHFSETHHFLDDEDEPGREHTPPDGDWATTISGLINRGAWRNERERSLLHRLGERNAAGTPPEEPDALWLRELWWRAELLNPTPPGGHR